MLDQFSRTELIFGKEKMKKLHSAKVMIFGLGGVGSYVLEGLVRAGVENFVLIDADTVSITNINRQLIATHKTVGMKKTEVAKARALEINPNAKIEIRDIFIDENSKNIIDKDSNYVVDAVDTVSAKLKIIAEAKALEIDVISSMGTGNKLDPTRIEVSDISKTSMCPLAKVMRKSLRKMGINHLKVVFSKEEPQKIDEELMKRTIEEENTSKKVIPASVSFVPSVAGLIIAGEVVKDIIGRE